MEKMPDWKNGCKSEQTSWGMVKSQNKYRKSGPAALEIPTLRGRCVVLWWSERI